MRTGLALALALLLCSSVASAGIQVEYEVTQAGVIAGHDQWTVFFVGDTPAEMASSFDGRFDGPMNQVWYVSVISTPTMDTMAYLAPPNTDPSRIAEDSHILLGSGDMAAVKNPSEDGPGLGSWLAAELDGSKTMAFGIKGNSQQQNLPFAQLVIPTGEQVHLVGGIGNAAGGPGIGVDVYIPEPATLGLLMFGGIGALLRRRRQ